MGSSLLLKGGTTTVKTIEETITVSHSFAVGDVVRYDYTNGWQLAQANNAENAEVVGVVKEVQSGSFKVVYSGYIDLNPRYASETSPVLFLSADTAGGLTGSPPSAIGTVVKPVLTRKSGSASGEYIVTNYLGTQIGGSSTVAVDEIQPVGTVMPFAGPSVPDTWLECNGASYSISSYPELYAKIQNSSGDRAPIYGYVATLTGTNLTTLSVGDVIQYKTSSTSPWSGTAIGSNADVVAVVNSVTSTSASVQIVPKYSTTNKSFEFSNTLVGSGSFAAAETSAANYRVYTSAGVFRQNITATISSASLTHFNTPDLRGRFALGINSSTITDSDYEITNTNNSAISGIYSLGSEGGQESTVAGTGLNTASSPTSYVTSVTTSGGLLPNMPPYLAVRYIIKAKPYTRAAIIDGIDIPYSQLLVSDLRPFTLRGAGSGEDLVFKTNDGSAGTERMRLTNTPSAAAPGGLVIGDTSHTSGGAGPFTTAYRLLEVATTSGSGGGVFVARSPSTIVEMGANEGLSSAIVGTRTNHPLVFRTNTVERLRIDSPRTTITHSSGDHGAANSGNLVVGNGVVAGNKQLQLGVSDTNNCAWIDSRLVGVGGLTLSIQPTGGKVGIATTTPNSTLDVNGTATVRGNAIFNGSVTVGATATFSGNAIIGATATIGGNATISGTLASTGRITANAGITVGNFANSNIMPRPVVDSTLNSIGSVQAISTAQGVAPVVPGTAAQTWFYFVFLGVSDGLDRSTMGPALSGVAAGGTALGTAYTNRSWFGFAIRLA